MQPKFWPLALAVLLSVLVGTPQPTWAQFVQQGPKLVGTGAVGNPVEQGAAVALSSDGNTAIVGGNNDSDDAGAAWIYVRSGGAWAQQAKLVATGAIGNAWQGTSVALSSDGNTAIVGGPGDNNYAGAAWIFTRSGTTWTEQMKLVGSVTGQTIAAEQGWSVALSGDGNTAIIGGPTDNSTDACPSGTAACSGAAWVFVRNNGGGWSQQMKLASTSPAGLPQLGFSVALANDGNTAIVGGWADSYGTTGAAWIYKRTGTSWSTGTKIVGSNPAGSSRQGWSVALSGDGNTAIVGGLDDSSDTGAVWIYAFNGGTWTQQGQKLTGSGATGTSNFGWSVALSSTGNTAIVGGWNDNNAAGAAWSFTRSGTTWSQQQKLVGSGAVVSGLAGAARQGSAVAISGDGNTVLVGGPIDNNEIGAAWAYMFSTTTVTLTSSVNPSANGQSVTFTATVSATGGTPTGMVTFFDGATMLGAGTLSSGTAMFSTAWLSIGSHSITAVYGGDGTFTGATSSVLTQVVNQAFTLSVGLTGSGTVTSSPTGINCGSTCSAYYPRATQVTLTATPADGWGFAGWGGACSGVGNCVVMMNAAQSVTATFAQTQYTLNVSVAGNGSVTSSPTGISCPSVCTMNYSSGTPVMLTATPTGGATFISWNGACTGSGSCLVTMNSLEDVTANFSASAPSPSSRTWVSATLGNDSNPCTRMSPCLTFAAALIQTTAGGEIDVLDPGDFGPVTITEAISIINDAVGVAGTISSPGTSGIVVSAGASDTVNLRGLIFDGINASGTSGVVLLSGARLNISQCVFQGFAATGMTLSPGVGSSPTTLLDVQDTTILNNATGLLIRPTSGIAAKVTLRGLRIDNNSGEGLRVDGTGGSGAINAALADSTASFNASNGIDAVSSPGNATLDIIRVVAAANGSAGIESKSIERRRRERDRGHFRALCRRHRRPGDRRRQSAQLWQ